MATATKPMVRDRRRAAKPCDICESHYCGRVSSRGTPCRPKRCEVCEKLMYTRDCPECGAPRGRHTCSGPDNCNCARSLAPKETP